MDKLIISSSSWHYRFLVWFNDGKNTFKHYWDRESLKITDSCHYFSLLVKATLGVTFLSCAVLFAFYAITFSLGLFLVSAISLSEYNLHNALATFSNISPNPMYEYIIAFLLAIFFGTMGLMVLGLIVVIGCTAKYCGAHIKFRKPLESSPLIKIAKAKFGRFCLPIKIEDTNK